MVAPTAEAGYEAGVWSSWWDPDDAEKTPELRWPLSIEVYDTMRRQDAQVMSVLRAVTLPIRRTGWRLDPAGARPEVVAWVADDLNLPVVGQQTTEQAVTPRRSRDRFSFPEHLRLALLCLAFGHSPFEQVYRIDPVTGMLHLRKLGWRPPRTISRIEVAADGGLVALEQQSIDGKPHRMTVDRLVMYVNDREGGNWLGQSLLRPAYKYWLLKDRLLRVGAQTVDRNGMGVPVYKGADFSYITDPDKRQQAEQADLDAGLSMTRAFRSGDNAGVAVPKSADLELKGVTGTLPDAKAWVDYYDEQIARAVLAHFLNLGTQTGSWALGSTFADFFTLSLQTVALAVCDVFNQHVIEDLVDLNWGPDEPAPQLVFDEIGSRNPVTAEAIKALIDAGALIPDENLEAHLRTTYGLPGRDVKTQSGAEAIDPQDAARARFAAETLQKLYLAVGVVITVEEARELARRAGVPLGGSPPDPPATPQPPPPATAVDPNQEAVPWRPPR